MLYFGCHGALTTGKSPVRLREPDNELDMPTRKVAYLLGIMATADPLRSEVPTGPLHGEIRQPHSIV